MDVDQRADRKSALTPGRTALVLGMALIVAAILSGADALLVKAARLEKGSAAATLYARAEALTAQGHPDAALEFYRLAHTQMRKDPRYRLALAEALQRVGRPEDAEAEARRTVLEEPTAGPANLLLARILVAQNKPDDAAWFYHRALYGTWPPGGEQQKTAARVEVAGLLAKRGATEQVIAEVLLLLNEDGADNNLKRQSADLLLKAGAWSRASQLYAELLRDAPKDVALHAGEGLASFGAGDFRRARTELAIAADLGATNPSLHRKLEIAQNVVERDPSTHGIGAYERARRSRNLLQAAVDTAQSCGIPAETPGKRSKDPDADVTQAEEIWRSIPDGCKTTPLSEALNVIFVQMHR